MVEVIPRHPLPCIKLDILRPELRLGLVNFRQALCSPLLKFPLRHLCGLLQFLTGFFLGSFDFRYSLPGVGLYPLLLLLDRCLRQPLPDSNQALAASCFSP